MRKILYVLFMMFCFNSFAFAVEFDSSIDSEIRKKYNLEETTLPPLPKEAEFLPEEVINTEINYNPTGEIYTLKRGTIINLTSLNNITNWAKKGSKVSFKAENGHLSKEGKVIPAGTIFKGTIVDSHPPQITGNGGLIELKIDEVYVNGVVSYIETKVSLANSKKIFLGNIKGQRKYWSNVGKVMTPGKKTFNAMQKCSSTMNSIPIVNLFSFVPVVGGTAVYTANLVVAPVIAIFKKGGAVSLPVGTEFQIKLTKQTQIRG